MQTAGGLVTASERTGQEAREYFRHPTAIPASVAIAHAWEGSMGNNLPADLLNVSRGGASLRVRWVFPPRTRLLVSISAGESTVPLLAEVVWTSLLPGRRPEPAVYGIRWIEQLMPRSLESLLKPPPSSREEAGGTTG